MGGKRGSKNEKRDGEDGRGGREPGLNSSKTTFQGGRIASEVRRIATPMFSQKESDSKETTATQPICNHIIRILEGASPPTFHPWL